ncbi:MAG: hypothetical protein OXI66_18420, partial [Boseongicola sp.]|nr:hypothetical protein [Boseongicola sp.]
RKPLPAGDAGAAGRFRTGGERENRPGRAAPPPCVGIPDAPRPDFRRHVAGPAACLARTRSGPHGNNVAKA